MVVMANGRLLMQGECKEVFARISELSQVGLDIPQITQLVARLRDAGLDIPADIYTVEEAVAAVRRALKTRKEEQA